MPDLQSTLVAMKREGRIDDAPAGAIPEHAASSAQSSSKYRLDSRSE